MEKIVDKENDITEKIKESSSERFKNNMNWMNDLFTLKPTNDEIMDSIQSSIYFNEDQLLLQIVIIFYYPRNTSY